MMPAAKLLFLCLQIETVCREVISIMSESGNTSQSIIIIIIDKSKPLTTATSEQVLTTNKYD